MSAGNQSWSVIVLCYNEEKSLKGVVTEFLQFFGENLKADFEIIIVNDGSTDASGKVAAELCSQDPRVSQIDFTHNMGMGAATFAGITAARFENLTVISGDGEVDPQDYKSQLTLPEGVFVTFCRRKLHSYSLWRKFISASHRWMNRLFLGIHLRDINWVKIYKTSHLKQLGPLNQGLMVETEMVAKMIRRGFTPIEVPCNFRNRISPQKNWVGLGTVFRAFSTLLKIRRELRRSTPNS